MKYPTKEQVVLANHTQICIWHRFLPSPANIEESEINTMIYNSFKLNGGFSPEISKLVDWDPDYE